MAEGITVGQVGTADGEQDPTGPRLASIGAAGMALSLGAVVVFASLPFFRIVGAVLGAAMVLLSIGLWRPWSAAVVLGIVVGGLAVSGGVPMLAAGDDVYEQVPSAATAMVPTIALAFGAVVLVGSAASVGRVGRAGQVVALVLLAFGVALAGLGVWRLVEPRGAPPAFGGAGLDCGSAFRPPSSISGTSSACWEVLGPARSRSRSMLSLGAVIALGGLGMTAGQFGRRAWPGIVIALGVGALGVGWAVSSMPLQSNACLALNESYTGPVCDGLRQALSAVTVTFAVLAGLLVALGVGLVVFGLIGRRAAPGPPGPPGQVRSGRSARRRPA